jgi:hypothetical protein
MLYKNNIKIPSKHYVGMVKRSNEKIPLGFITPWGDDSAAKKRMATVDGWAKQSGNKSKIPTMVIENVPMSGFKMTTDIRSSSYGGSDKWRIEDPRGFELEITSHNLAQLLSVGMIDRGEISDTCVWARDGQVNVLLSTSTEEYKNAVENTKVSEMTANWKDVKIGNKILLKNNISGIWLGKMFSTGVSYYSRETTENLISVSSKSSHIIYVEKDNKKTLIIINNPKLASILSDDIMTDADAELFANEMLNDSQCNVEQSGYGNLFVLTIGSPKFGENANLSLKPLKIDNEEMLKDMTFGKKGYVFTKNAVSLFRVDFIKNYNYNKTDEFRKNEFSLDAFNQSKLSPVGEMQKNTNYWNSTYIWQQKHHMYSYNPNDTFYNLMAIFNTKSGNKIEVLVK